MRVVKVLCCQNKGLLHKIGVWAIKKSEGTDFNHVAILSEDDLVYEAVFPKTRKLPFKEWVKLFDLVRIYEIKMSKEMYDHFIYETAKCLNKNYSLFQCFMIWVSNSIGVLESSIEKTIWNGNKALICSELVAWPIKEVLKYRFSNTLDTVGMDEIEEALKTVSSVNYL